MRRKFAGGGGGGDGPDIPILFDVWPGSADLADFLTQDGNNVDGNVAFWAEMRGQVDGETAKLWMRAHVKLTVAGDWTPVAGNMELDLLELFALIIDGGGYGPVTSGVVVFMGNYAGNNVLGTMTIPTNVSPSASFLKDMLGSNLSDALNPNDTFEFTVQVAMEQLD